MILAERIRKLLSELESGLVERESLLKLAFLAVVTKQPTYLYGRAGSGKRAMIRHLVSGFKGLDIQIYGRRQFELPEEAKPADVAIFNSFDPAIGPMAAATRAVLDENLARETLISGRIRPDACLSEAGLSDSIHLVLTFPDSISPDALKTLLSTAGDPEFFFVEEDLKVTPDDLKSWDKEIEQVEISEDSLAILKQIAAECERSNIYISAKRWRGLAKMGRAQAFFAGRSETNVTDFLFLSEDLWGKRTTNEAISKGFQAGVETFLGAYAPDPESLQGETHDLLQEAEHFKNSTGSLYKTTKIDGKEYISYSITVFNEPITLFCPLSKLGTNEDFFPLNILHREEPRAKCNYMGGDICKISIDSKAKRNGMRASSSVMGNSSAVPNANTVYESYAKLPSEIIKTNDPETVERNREGLEAAHKKLSEIIANSIQSIRRIKDLYNKNFEYQNDPFLSVESYKKFMNLILKRYRSLGAFSKELQQYETALSQISE